MTTDLDTRGLLCPLPVLKLRKMLGRIEAGAEIAMVADDPAARVDVPHFCHEQGHELVSLEDGEDGTLLFKVRKRGGA